MTVVKTKYGIAVHAPGRCGDCPGVLTNPGPPPQPPPEPPVLPGPSDRIYFLEGWEDNSAVTNLYSLVGTAPTYVAPFRGATLTGVRAMEFNSGIATGFLNKGIGGSAANAMFFRVYFQLTSLVFIGGGLGEIQFFGIGNGGIGIMRIFFRITAGPVFRLEIQAANQPVVAGTAVLTVGTSYRLELTLSGLGPGVHTVTAQLFDDLTGTLLDTIGPTSGSNGVGILTLGIGTATSDGSKQFFYRLDDICVRNDLMPGPGGIWLAFPNGNSAVTWTPLSGQNFQMVDDFPGPFDADGSYNETTVVGAKDLFAFGYAGSTPPATSQLYHSDQRVITKAATGGVVVRDTFTFDGIPFDGAVRSQGSTYTFPGTPNVGAHLFAIWEGIPRTVIDSLLRFGYQLTASSPGTARASLLWCNLDFRPAPP